MEQLVSDPNVYSRGFRVWSERVDLMSRAHTHPDIEVNYVVTGAFDYLFGRRCTPVKSGELAVFWAGLPHRVAQFSEPTHVVLVTIPISWFLQWRLSREFRRRVLTGDLVTITDPNDAALLSGWVDDFAGESRDLQEIVLTEVEARIRRLGRLDAPGTAEMPSTTDWFDQVMVFIGEGYCGRLTVSSIAAAVELHPNYLMRAFKRRCGVSLWEYILRLRVSHAERLLATTDATVVNVALAAGFGSVARFYATFERVCGLSPGTYRKLSRAPATP